MPILLNKTIRLFLDSIGKREEYQYYLQRFHASQSTAFALICPERMGLEEVAEVFAFDLEFLLRLEIFPAILLSGEGANEMRDILFSGSHHYQEMNLCGRILNRKAISDIETFLNECRDFQRVGVLLIPERTCGEVLPSLLPAISKRLHLIRLRGPLHKCDGSALMYYHTHRPDRPELAGADESIASLATRLLEQIPDLHISIASPWNLLQELFTIKGAGCLVRRGSIIQRVDNPRSLDRARLANLMQASFGRKIRSDALEMASDAFIEVDYRGAALLERRDSGWYLSKFAVETAARGEGLAGEIWGEMIAGNPSMFWRSRSSNPINHWYRRHSDGSHDAGEWTVFWRNVEWRKIPEIIDYSLGRPDDFEE